MTFPKHELILCLLASLTVISQDITNNPIELKTVMVIVTRYVIRTKPMWLSLSICLFCPHGSQQCSQTVLLKKQHFK